MHFRTVLPFSFCFLSLVASVSQRLAVGTSKGLLLVYDIERGVADLNLVTVVTAHPPEKGESQDMRFGQLGKQYVFYSILV